MSRAILGRGAILALVGLGGCYKTTSIRPDQLPLLNASAEGGIHLKDGTVGREVIQSTGAVAVIGESFDVQASTKQGAKYEFTPPMESEINAGILKVHSTKQPEATMKLDDVSRMDVRTAGGPSHLIWAVVVIGVAIFVTYEGGYALAGHTP